MTNQSAMAVLLTDVLPVAAQFGLGYALGRMGLVGEDQARTLNWFALMIAAPLLVFGLLAQQSSGAFLPGVAVAYLGAELATFAAVFLIAWRVFHRPAAESLLVGLSAALVNHVYLVLPVASNVYGPAAAAPVLSIVTIDSVVIVTGTVVLMDFITSGGFNLRTLLRTFARMPYLPALFAGVAWSMTGLPLPEGLAVFTAFGGAAASPVALFAAGVIMSTIPVLKFDALALAAIAAKLLLAPALAALAFNAAGFPISQAGPALLVAAGPAGAFAMAFAIHYRVGTATIGRIIVLTTAGSVVTMSLLA